MENREGGKIHIPYTPGLFQAATVGRLMAGIVHNINGPLQIISMHMELLRMDLATCKERIKESLPGDSLPQKEVIQTLALQDARLNKLQTALSRLEEIGALLTARVKVNKDGSPLTHLSHMIHQVLTFWQGDLFFKHQVEKEVKIDPEILLPFPPTLLCFLMDTAMAHALYSLRHGSGDKTLKIFTENNGQTISLHMDWSYKVESKRASDLDVSPEERLERDLLSGLLPLARGVAGENGISMELSNGRFTLLFPVSS